MSIKENVNKLKKDIPENINILAATKTHNIDEITQSIYSGIKTIGENYVSEAEKKYPLLKEKVKIHCIGHLQTNKVKKAVLIFDMIETIDSEKIAKEIDKECGKIGKLMQVLIEVNVAEESNKNGCLPENVEKLAGYVKNLQNIELKGLMTMGPLLGKPEEIRPYFGKTKELFDKLKKIYPEIDTLSMGMSDSYKIAIEEGATMVRLGSAIFGKRS